MSYFNDLQIALTRAPLAGHKAVFWDRTEGKFRVRSQRTKGYHKLFKPAHLLCVAGVYDPESPTFSARSFDADCHRVLKDLGEPEARAA